MTNGRRRPAGSYRAARDYLKSDLAPAVDLLADDNPEFVRGFSKPTSRTTAAAANHLNPLSPPPPNNCPMARSGNYPPPGALLW